MVQNVIFFSGHAPTAELQWMNRVNSIQMLARAKFILPRHAAYIFGARCTSWTFPTPSV